MNENGWTAQALLITCEHAGNLVPAICRDALVGAGDLLETHRGHDIGAHDVALQLAARFRAPLLAVPTTRLVIDPNRSLHHPAVFSEFTQGLPAPVKAEIARRHHRPHRDAARAWLGSHVGIGMRSLHVGVHSFVDVLDDTPRDVDIGLLFDPDRAGEAALCQGWAERLLWRRRDLRIALNRPYLGTDDGLTTTLRREFPAELYAGVEIEIRQGLMPDLRYRKAVADLLGETLLAALAF